MHISRHTLPTLALCLLMSIVGTATAQQKLAPGEVNGVGPERLMPVPKVGPNDAPRECVSSDGPTPRYLPETKISMQDVSALRRWGVVHFKIRGDCSDWDFVVSKWQETLGSPVTGVLTPSDEAKIAQILKAHRSQVLPFDPNRAVAQPQVGPMSTMPEPASFLPAPKIEPGDSPRACATAGSRRAESEAAGSGVGMLRTWGRIHFKLPANCTDWDFVIAKWQETVGHPVTGIATMADAESIREELRKTRSQFQEAWDKFEQPRAAARDAAREIARKRSDDMPKTVADFLPQGRGLVDCTALQNQASAQVRSETQARIAALPRGAVNSARTEAIQREVSDQATKVAAEWTELWKRKPELTIWATKYGCRSLHFGVAYWQSSIGVPVDPRDPQGIARSEQLIAKAESDLSEFQTGQASRFSAEAQASGETARIRTWSLDELSATTSMSAVLDRMPSAFCIAQQMSVNCTKKPPCTVERAAQSAAAGKLNLAKLGRPLNDMFWAPPSDVTRAVQDADADLKRCEAKSRYSAEANSHIMFAGLEANSATLSFGDRGLVAMKFFVPGDVELARGHLTQRYGLPQSQQEMRTELVSTPTGGGIVYVPGAGQVVVPPSHAQVPMQYSVTRYVWKTSDVLVEESTGAFTFRFSVK